MSGNGGSRAQQVLNNLVDSAYCRCRPEVRHRRGKCVEIRAQAPVELGPSLRRTWLRFGRCRANLVEFSPKSCRPISAKSSRTPKSSRATSAKSSRIRARVGRHNRCSAPNCSNSATVRRFRQTSSSRRWDKYDPHALTLCGLHSGTIREGFLMLLPKSAPPSPGTSAPQLPGVAPEMPEAVPISATVAKYASTRA